MNRKIEKRIRNKGEKKRIYLSIFAFVMLLFVPVSVYATETKSDGNTTQAMEEENKTVRVGYFPYANFQEGGYGEHKQGAGYEYLQKISYITGWKYEYVYASFKECLDMLEDGEIDILGSVSYTPERAESIDFSTYAEGTERYWIYTREEHMNLAEGELKQMNGCRIGVADGSYQKELLEKWLDSNQIQAEVVSCKGYDEMIEKLDADELDALVVPALSVNSDFIAIANIGASDCYFGVAKSRPDLLKELNSALEEINNTETDYSNKLYARYEGKAVINYALSKEEKLKKDIDLHGLHVLLAEDNDLNAKIAVALLEEQGMIVTRTADGKSALAQFCDTASETFDLILMDIMMPEMNGYETTKAIRNLPERPDGKKIPIIAMTANAFAEDVQAALNAGMDDHVAKPVDMSILIAVITKYIER